MTQLLKDLKERLDWLVAVPDSTDGCAYAFG